MEECRYRGLQYNFSVRWRSAQNLLEGNLTPDGITPHTIFCWIGGSMGPIIDLGAVAKRMGCGAARWGTALQAGRSVVRFPMVSLGFLISLNFPAALWPWDWLRILQKWVKGKAVPLQARSGPEGSRKLRFPDYMTTAQDGGKVVNLTHRPPLPPGNTPGTHFF